MTITKLSNPKKFVKDANKVGVFYEYLQESIICTGKQATARLFSGKSNRGIMESLSAATIENWIYTFEYVQKNPNEKDTGLNSVMHILPQKEWYEYVKIIKNPIPEHVIKSWENISLNHLGDDVKKYGYTIGLKNYKSKRDLRERIMEMVKRRREKIWNGKAEEKKEEKKEENIFDEKPDYKYMNIFRLKSIAQEKNIVVGKLRKEDIIKLFEEHDKTNPKINFEIKEQTYDTMTLFQLKKLSKDRGFSCYNNLKKDNLIEMHKKYDKENKDIKTEEKKETCLVESGLTDKKLVIAGIDIIARKSDNYVNATRLCQAGNKKFFHWNENNKSKLFVKALSQTLQIPVENLIYTGKGSLVDVKNNLVGNPMGGLVCQTNTLFVNEKLNYDTWCHPRIGINIAQWISPEFDVAVSGWIYDLLSTGSVKLSRPIQHITNLNDIDIEAEILEKSVDISQFSNKFALYISYVGSGLVKIGSSDCKMMQRDKKHQTSESEFTQWRIIKLFEISSRKIEKLIQDLLIPYKFPFGKQVEIFKPIGKLEEFIKIVSNLLVDNDLKLQLDLYKLENLKLTLRLEKCICFGKLL